MEDLLRAAAAQVRVLLCDLYPSVVMVSMMMVVMVSMVVVIMVV
jgi:hypothetical protein